MSRVGRTHRRSQRRPAYIDRSLRAEDGSVVVAVVDGQLSCKRYRMAGNRGRLDFDNPEMPAFAVDE
ncbi:S24 family peptidase [Methylobacterium sp. HMF5984]|uniref:S24 family peptidase n=1 Tax=Methylobacterium sp. HMF5984 TaxID=3367370 RepID=UPI0038537CB1